MRPVLLLLLGLVPCALAAQAGFPPSQSPYREVHNGGYLELGYGRVYGGGGMFDLGPRDGTSYGVRAILRGNHTLQFSFGGWTAGTERSVIDAEDSVAVRNKGLYPQRLIAGEIGIQLNITGGKTWHGFAPYVNGTFGLVNGHGGPATDTSGYSFGNKIYFAPGTGTRLYIGQRLYLRVDIRALFWKLSYPASYSMEPADQPGTTAAPNAVNPTGISGQYTLTPEVRFGLGVAW